MPFVLVPRRRDSDWSLTDQGFAAAVGLALLSLLFGSVIVVGIISDLVKFNLAIPATVAALALGALGLYAGARAAWIILACTEARGTVGAERLRARRRTALGHSSWVEAPASAVVVSLHPYIVAQGSYLSTTQTRWAGWALLAELQGARIIVALLESREAALETARSLPPGLAEREVSEGAALQSPLMHLW